MERETLLLEPWNKDAEDPETLANLVVCCLHLGKPPSRLVSQSRLAHPDHVLIKGASAVEREL
ncbi:putative coatomer, epsilon subunit protein [Rosa chinensis]|uniref:Putative coatomer, epsilon subunit protein n=1 Tax=Rosa chinensis TaxID=74649 RepID=A0A2P6SD22_ROSCH|nr:putative coatomer, epsilon subunit protein [Rosa chinensis]PRQ60881.1 putative coatomer, epsilon subunit protein [Rosa chinensis]